MKNILNKSIVMSALALASQAAFAINLPTGPCNGQNCLQFTDFQVYSLTLLNGGSSNSGPYAVDATPGSIKDYVVVGVNNGGQAQTNIAGIDNAYNTPSANNIKTFTNMTTDTTNGPASGDGNSWQASISTLASQFVGSKFVGFFAFNETGTQGGSTATNLLDGGPDLLVWAKITLVDIQNTLNNKSFYLQPTGSALSNDPLANPLPPSNATGFGDTGPWAYVHGSICMNGGVFTGFPDANGVCAVGQPKAQTNTGQNNAAFAIYNQQLDDEIHNKNTIFDTLQIDWQMAYINGGGETAWIQPFGTRDDNNVPEPTTLALLALAFIGLGANSKLKQKYAVA